MSSSCRVYLFTYKRSTLLKRAIESLLAQTHVQWVCELHNDSPDDPFPDTYIASLKDSRFILKTHYQNLGPTRSFNLAFLGCDEKYAAILEDDNWWEPNFLTEMIGLMDSNPALDMAWSNMYIWKEQADGRFVNTDQTTWPVGTGTTQFSWPQQKQGMGALHSNSAMIYKGSKARKYLTPPDSDFAIMETIRDRTFSFPVALHQTPLANFSDTLRTSRGELSWVWTINQVMVLNSFINTAPAPEDAFKSSLKYYRSQKPSPVANFVLAAVLLEVKGLFLRHFTVKDWLVSIRWLLINCYRLPAIKQYLTHHEKVNRFIQKATRQRYEEV